MANRKYLPSFRRRQLGQQLRELRQAAGISMPEAGELLGVTHQTVSNMELGVHRVRKAELGLLLDRYRAAPQARDRLEVIRADADSRGWWLRYGGGAPDWLRPGLDLESAAAAVTIVEPNLIPAPLRTERYSRAVYSAAGSAVPPAEVERAVEVDAERARRLVEEPRPTPTLVILGEAALHQAAGGQLIEGQLHRLLTLADSAMVQLRVLPFTAGAHAAGAGGFTLFDFGQPELPSQVFVPLPAGGVVVDDAEDVARYAAIVAALREAALDPADSSKLVRSQLDQ